MAEKEYYRLARTRARVRFAAVSAGSSSLWLGKDHLLAIESNGYTEKYKRFYYRDIQALIIQKTERYKWMNIALSVLAAAFLFPAFLSNQIVLNYLFGIVGGVFAAFLIVNVALGASSVCRLQTAVQIEELPSLSRLRRARKVLNRLRPFIEAAQGALPAEEIASRLQGSPIQERPVSSSAPSAPSVDQDFIPPQSPSNANSG